MRDDSIPEWAANPPGSDTQRTLMNQHLTALAEELRQFADAVEVLRDNPPGEDRHGYVEAVSLASRAASAAYVRANHLAYVARSEPAQVSIPRLAAALGVSVNTLRTRLPRIGKGSKPDAENFREF